MGRDRHRWAGARRRPARVLDYPDTDLSLLSEQHGHDELIERQSSTVIFFDRSRGMPIVNRTSRVLHEPPIKQRWAIRDVSESFHGKSEHRAREKRNTGKSGPPACTHQSVCKSLNELLARRTVGCANENIVIRLQRLCIVQ